MLVCGIMTALLALHLRIKANRPQLRLFFFMASATLLYTGHFIFFNGIKEAIPFSDTVYCFCNPAVYPLFYIYIEELTIRRPNRLWQFYYLQPAIICFLTVGFLYLLMDHAEMVAFIEYNLYHNDFSGLSGLAWWQGVAHTAVKVIHALEIPPVLYFGWKRISHYDHLVKNYYSDTEGKTAGSIRSLLIVLVLASIASFVCNAIGRTHFNESIWLAAVPLTTFSILLLIIGHVGLHQQFYINDIEIDEIEDDAFIPDDIKDDLGDKLLKLMDQEKYYLNPNLKIDELSKLLNSNRNYIYHTINMKMGLTFSEFINSKRIDYSAEMIENNPEIHLSEVATKSGFTSSSAFYRNFKHFKGCTPREFQQELLKNNTVPRPRIELGTKL